MTKQQAINILNGLEQSLDDYCELNNEGKAAFRMAITALESFGNSEQLPSEQPDATDINVGTTIYRQAAIDAMCGACSDWCDEGVCRKVSAIQKLPPAQRWIPCSEMMPEEETDVLICNSTGNIAISRGAYSTEASDWIWYTSGWRFGEAIAWMPLPEPYKAERREDD